MFKRANKITALLVAAASVMSVVPAMADDSSSKLASKDGTIENAVAYQNGKYVYQGYKSEDDSDAVYYNDGGKDKALDDLEDADLNGAYADKYAFANDGSDQYAIDLTNGEVDDDITPEDDADSAATKLQTKLKKTDRYGDGLTINAADNFANYHDVDNETGALPGNKFGDVWYSYSVSDHDAPDMDANSSKVTTSGSAYGYLYGFNDQSGKYIDASYTANIYAYSTAEGKMVKIDNYSNDFGDVDDDTKLLATLTSQPVVLTQDKDYIYALVNVAITDAAPNAVITGGKEVEPGTVIKAVSTKDNDAYLASKTTVRTYIQKISKVSDGDKDDANLPKTVESYEVGNKYVGDNFKEEKEFDCGDATDAYDAISDITGKAPEALTQEDIVDSETGKAKFTVVDGNLVGIDTRSDDDKVKGITFTFKKDKVKFKGDVKPGYKGSEVDKDGKTTSAKPWDEDDKVDAYFLEKDSDDSVDIDNDDKVENSYDFDVDGNLWVVADGKIYEYSKGEMNKKFAVDSSLDSLSVYDENSMIAWEDDGDIYTTISEGKDTDTTTTAPAAKTGWVQLADGTWNFYDATGTKVVNNWYMVGGVWYYLGADGAMQTGWITVGGTWYYLNTSGAMQTGWVTVGGTWYYLNASGAMQTGWYNDNGTWYYLNASGAMLANTTVDGYVLGASGAWIQ